MAFYMYNNYNIIRIIIGFGSFGQEKYQVNRKFDIFWHLIDLKPTFTFPFPTLIFWNPFLLSLSHADILKPTFTLTFPRWSYIFLNLQSASVSRSNRWEKH